MAPLKKQFLRSQSSTIPSLILVTEMGTIFSHIRLTITQPTLTPRLTTLPTVCHATMFMVFYQRCQRPPLSPARCRNSCWTYSSTRKPTGHPRLGNSTSGVFSGGISTVDTKNIRGRHETLHQILFHLQHHRSIPTLRAVALLLHLLPG